MSCAHKTLHSIFFIANTSCKDVRNYPSASSTAVLSQNVLNASCRMNDTASQYHTTMRRTTPTSTGTSDDGDSNDDDENDDDDEDKVSACILHSAC